MEKKSHAGFIICRNLLEIKRCPKTYLLAIKSEQTIIPIPLPM